MRRLPASICSCSSFTLIEVLVVVMVIALLMALLLPSLAAAREESRRTVCGVQLKQIGIAGVMYSDDSAGWIVGSPNTSGNGARPGFAAGAYTDTYNPEHAPAIHVFDWANPLRRYLNLSVPPELHKRYDTAVGEPFHCPSNRREAGPGFLVYALRYSPAPSYATSRYFLYVGSSQQSGEVAGTLWWADDCVPDSYLPRQQHIRNPASKAFLADAHVVSNTQGQIVNANYGFASHGAWRCNKAEPGTETYRGDYLREEIWRHNDAINLLAFDGHVERQPEGDSCTHGGYGQQARKVTWWFPSGTRTRLLPGYRASDEADLVVP